MRAALGFSLADPGRRVFETPGRQVTLLGTWEKDLPPAERWMAGSLREAARSIVPREIDGALVIVDRDAGRNVAGLAAYRGPASGVEVFLAEGEDGLFLSDSFREAAAFLPPGDRAPSGEAFLDFLLFQHTFGPQSPLRGIRRLGHGELLEADGLGHASVSLLSRLEVSESPPGFGQALDEIEEILAGVLGKVPCGTANLFSGGVDSTLLQVLGGKGHPAVTAVPDCPEFAFETAAARRSASLCGVILEEVPVEENRYREILKAETASGGIPLPLLQVPVLAAAMDFAAPGFTGGFVADSLFSLPRGKRQAVRGGENPELFGPETFSVSSERALLEGLFGKEAVAARIRERDEYVLSRVECPQGLSPLELGCLASFYCSSAPVYRQLALARNKSLYNAYAARPLVQRALSLSVPGRLFRDGSFKPVLKGILSRHLPSYPVDEEKGGTGLPRTRFCRQGPLKGYFSENALPRFPDPGRAGPILDPGWGSSMTAFRCIAWSMWEKTLKTLVGRDAPCR